MLHTEDLDGTHVETLEKIEVLEPEK